MAGPKRPGRTRPASFSPKAKKPQPRAPARPVEPPRAPASPKAASAVAPARPRAVEPPPDLVAQARRGSSGRSLGRESAEPAPAAPEPAPPTESDGASPFAKYGGDVEMSGHLEQGRADTIQVVAIMAGLLVVVGSAIALSATVLVVGLAWTGSLDEMAGGAGSGDDDPTHIRDTGIVDGRVIEAPQRVPRKGGSAPAPETAPQPEAPKPAPVVVNIEQGVFFHEVEVSCPSGFRGRARVRNSQATVANVPPNQECRVTFKGGQPAQTKVSAGQTIACTFDPTVCRVTRR